MTQHNRRIDTELAKPAQERLRDLNAVLDHAGHIFSLVNRCEAMVVTTLL
jgi:hypothetical protein